MDEQYIVGKIREMMPDEHNKPRGVLYTRLKLAIQQDVSSVLSRLFKAGKIKYNRTLNDILININDNEQQEHQTESLQQNQEGT